MTKNDKACHGEEVAILNRGNLREGRRAIGLCVEEAFQAEALKWEEHQGSHWEREWRGWRSWRPFPGSNWEEKSCNIQLTLLKRSFQLLY